MFTLEELSNQVAAYKSGKLKLGEFEEWFENNSIADVYDDPRLKSACIAVDAAFSEYHFDCIGEGLMQSRLSAAVRDVVAPAVLAAPLALTMAFLPHLGGEPRPYFDHWKIQSMPVGFPHENVAAYAWGTHGANNSTVQRILPQKETEVAWGHSVFMTTGVLAQAQS